jgi:hypothetical protein
VLEIAEAASHWLRHCEPRPSQIVSWSDSSPPVFSFSLSISVLQKVASLLSKALVAFGPEAFGPEAFGPEAFGPEALEYLDLAAFVAVLPQAAFPPAVPDSVVPVRFEVE